MITKIANTAQYGGSGGAVYFGLSPGEWQILGIVGGLLVAALGFAVNLWFQHQRDRREQVEHDRRMGRL